MKRTRRFSQALFDYYGVSLLDIVMTTIMFSLVLAILGAWILYLLSGLSFVPELSL